MRRAMGVTRDASSAWLLERIVFWSQFATIKRDGLNWVANSYEQWVEETELPLRRVRTVIDNLRVAGIIRTERKVFGGKTILQVAVTPEGVAALAKAKKEIEDRECQKSSNGICRPPSNGKGGICRPSSNDIQGETLQGETSWRDSELAFAEGEDDMSSAKDVLEKHKAKKVIDHHKADKVKGLEMIWMKLVAEEYGGYQVPFTQKARGQLKHLMNKLPGTGAKVIAYAIGNWSAFTERVQFEKGAKGPFKPAVEFLLVHVQTVIDMMDPPKAVVTQKPKHVQDVQLIAKPKVQEQGEAKPQSLEELQAILNGDDD